MLCPTVGLISAGREAHQDPAPRSAPRSPWFVTLCGELYSLSVVPEQLRGQRRKVVSCSQEGGCWASQRWVLFPPASPAISTPCPRSVPPGVGGARGSTGCRTQEASVLRLPQSSGKSDWGSCKGFWEVSVNYPTCTLQPFLVFATGEKSSFRPGRGGEQSH